MQYGSRPTDAAIAMVAGSRRAPYWLDDPRRPAAAPPLDGHERADLLVVGGGFTGLWCALLAKEADPGRDVVLLEGGRIADGASGRNGGFVASSLTHGFANGLDRWPEEMPELLRLGRENLEAIAETVTRLGIDCDFTLAGELDVAVEAYQVDSLARAAGRAEAMGEVLEVLDAAGVRARLDSPLYLGGVLDRTGVALVNPARLAWGLRTAAEALGVRIFERTPVQELTGRGARVTARTRGGTVQAERVALATNAYPPLLRRIGHYVVPVYDYVLVSEPLTDGQWSSIGWQGGEGVSDAGNQFHYYRPTPDGRILWGGYDAIYHRGNGFGPEFEHSVPSYERLAQNFLTTFPQLAGLRFSHAWGGAIDTCSRFSAFWGTAHAGRTAYVAGYTGLGVGAARFGAATMLDLLNGSDTERTRLEMVRSKPMPFPPEPLRAWGIGLTTASLRRADEHDGRRNLWLRSLDRLGLGFDS
ncbi:MAG: FAD-dependent oxidoreductase [Actinomycetota bacterium]|nr:FAD-dependent oxidoreductase [Actinomycetota bacterium]